MRYFLRVSARRFNCELAPILSESRRSRSFEPVQRWARGRDAGSILPILRQIQGETAFSTGLWRLVTSEVLAAAANDIPLIETPLDTYSILLDHPQVEAREHFSPIQRSVLGTRDLTFGPFVFRPDRAGLNDQSDMLELAGWLQEVDLQRWTPENLSGGARVSAEDLAFAREWFPELVRLYQQAAQEGDVVVCDDAT